MAVGYVHGGVSGNSNFAMMSGSKSNFSNSYKRWNDSWFFSKKIHILRVKNSFVNRIIWVGSYFSCKLERKLFSSELKRELIRLNTETMCRRGSKGSKRKPQTLVLNSIQQGDIRFTCCSINKTSIV